MVLLITDFFSLFGKLYIAWLQIGMKKGPAGREEAEPLQKGSGNQLLNRGDCLELKLN
jgi:hypothetical protein